MIYPATFEQKIGFDRLREQVAARCTMRAARERLAAEGFSTSAREIERRLALADEMRLLLDMEHDFPGGEYPDVDYIVAKLRVEGSFLDVEEVVPLPLHPVKRCRRGYNQSEYIAEGIAAQLGVEVDRRSVRRVRNTASQALKPRRERAGNVEDAFAVCRPERLAGRHVLLVDDVMTTGSTLLSCASAILRDAPGCRISIAALAVSQRELGVKE